MSRPRPAEAQDFGALWHAAMRRGDFASAWNINDLVLAAREAATRDDPTLPYHLRWVWDGSPFAGRNVLVRCYHGLGDTLQFARFLPALRRHAAHVTLEVQPELAGVLTAMRAADRIAPFDPADPLPPSECDMEIMELSHALRMSPRAAAPPYLYAPPARLPPGTVGLCWRAGAWDPARSIAPCLLARLRRLPIVALQPDPAGIDVLNPEGSPPHIGGTASLIAGTALVITVDSMVAHLAGALGHPTCLLLKHDADWRWMRDPDDSPWYPSFRLYRQPVPGDWASVIDRLISEVEEELLF